MRSLTITETQWLAQVIELGTILGWEHYHPLDSRGSDAGYPDLTLVHPGQRRVIWVELKTGQRQLTEGQRKWRDLLRAAGQEWYCWRPGDFDLATEILKEKRNRRTAFAGKVLIY